MRTSSIVCEIDVLSRNRVCFSESTPDVNRYLFNDSDIDVATKSTHNDKLMHDAETWVVRLRSDCITADDKKAFSEWLSESVDHATAFDHVFEEWETLGHITPSAETLGSFASRNNSPRNLAQQWFRSLWPSGTLLASCVGAILVIAVYLNSNTADTSAPISYQTSAGQSMNVTLPDGSVAELNTRTHIEAHFDKNRRALKLLSGEAYFSVAKDQKRPFTVDFGRGTATALGTQFNVYRLPDSTAITVTEGLVAVSEMADVVNAGPEARQVGENQQIKVGRRGLGAVKDLDPQRSTAWRDKTIIFKSTPLSSAVEELNRYLDSPIAISDTGLGEHRVSGVFSTDKPYETAEAFIEAFNLTSPEPSPRSSLAR